MLSFTKAEITSFTNNSNISSLIDYLPICAYFFLGLTLFAPHVLIGLAAREWAPKEYYSTSGGFVKCFAQIGGSFAGAPVAFLIEKQGWQNTFGYLTILGSFKFMYNLYHPIFVLSLSGLLVLILNIEIPSIIMNSTKYLGNIVIPLSLILLGYSLSNLRIKNLTKGFIYSIARFLIGVLSALIVIYLFEISGPKAGVILIMSTMPVALLNYIFTVQIEKDTTTVAGLVVVSTFSTLICLPFLLNFLLVYFN